MLLARATQYDSIIEKAAVSAAVEANLLRAVIVVESGFNSRAVSKRGAVGLMQLMPATATRFGVSNPFDPKQNVHAGARYLKFLIDRFGQDIQPRARRLQRRRRGRGPQRRPDSAVHRNHGLRAASAQDLSNAHRAAAQHLIRLPRGSSALELSVMPWFLVPRCPRTPFNHALRDSSCFAARDPPVQSPRWYWRRRA